MPLSAGAKLGPYEILAPIRTGGIGEVYRAKDTKLDREVAIKVLPAALAQDPERLARFEREAKALAPLNHPNIAIIHGLENIGTNARAVVMGLVEGPTLSDRLVKGALLLHEILSIARPRATRSACALSRRSGACHPASAPMLSCFPDSRNVFLDRRLHFLCRVP
ncbi:MAG: protein kinase domain-containing protein [Bryobacteraceae bacterium]